MYQVAFFTATPSNIPADSSEVYAAALAHVAEGFVAKNPRLIQEADALFSQLQQADPSVADSEMSSSQLEYAMERGICALLLGEVGECRAWLGLEDEKSPFRDPSVVNFVYSYSEEGEETDSLPGLCKLLEGWLTEMVFPRFRDTESLRVKLNDYFDEPSVLSYLEGLEKGSGSHMAAIVRIGAGAGAALNNVRPLSRKCSLLAEMQKARQRVMILKARSSFPDVTSRAWMAIYELQVRMVSRQSMRGKIGRAARKMIQMAFLSRIRNHLILVLVD